MKDDRMTQAELEQAVDKWYIDGALPKALYGKVRDSLRLAFQIAVSERLTKETNRVCGK